jgi:ribonuclease BN (tRNA processing enzyme)
MRLRKVHQSSTGGDRLSNSIGSRQSKIGNAMRLQFLGTGGYHPNERRQTACLLLPEIGVILDAGTGFFRVAERLRTEDVQIFLTHAHLDHIVGLTYSIVPFLLGKIRRARLFSDDVYLQAVREHLYAQSVFPAQPPYEFVTLPDSVALPGGGELTWRRLKHPGGSIGFKLTWPGRSLAYITDTTADGSYTEFVRGVDVLVHECYFPDDLAEWCEKTGHSHTSQVATLARDAGVGRLLLTHIDPQRADDDPIRIDIARLIFPATEVAKDLSEVEF